MPTSATPTSERASLSASKLWIGFEALHGRFAWERGGSGDDEEIIDWYGIHRGIFFTFSSLA
jgi:hypothetical protein